MILLLAGVLLADVGGPSRGFDIERCGILRTITPSGGDVFRVAFRPDGRRLAAGFEDGTVRLYDTADWREVAKWEAGEGKVQALAWSPDGKTVATGGLGLDVRVWDAETRKLRASYGDPTGMAQTLVYSRDGRWLAVGGRGKTIGVYDLSTGRAQVITAHPLGVTAVAFTRDGTRLVSSDLSGEVVIRSTGDWKVRKRLMSPGGYVSALALSSDDRLLVTCGTGNKELAVWDVKEGRVVRSLKGPTLPVNAVAFLQGSRYVAAAGADMGVWLWKVGTGEQIGPLRHHLAALNDVAVHPRGRLFVTAAHDRKIKVWGALPAGVEVDRPPGFCGITVTPGADGRVMVSQVHPGTGAERGGFAAGDVLLEVGGVAVKTTEEAIDRISSYLSGDKVRFTIERGGVRKTLAVTLGSRPEFKR